MFDMMINRICDVITSIGINSRHSKLKNGTKSGEGEENYA